LADALYLDLVSAGGKAVGSGQLLDKSFQLMLAQSDGATALGACQVVVMVAKLVGEFQFVLPTGVETLHDAKTFE
jgi:hypothetical protein